MKHANIALFVPHVGCTQQCSFCDQRIISGAQVPPDAASVRHICAEAASRLAGRTGQTEIAFFGGSFTAIPRAYMLELLEAASQWVQNGVFQGIRVSTRPDRIDDAVLELLRDYGVTAVELGAQSMDNAVLSHNSRGHTAHAVEVASERIRAYGLELGLQMMLGLPGDSESGAWETARQLAALHPTTVRIYPTVVLRGTQLAQWFESGCYQPITVEESVRLGAGLLDFFESQGIRVIRLGLHASQEVEQRLLAGGYHPALRELCESRLYRDAVVAQLAKQAIPLGSWKWIVAPGCVSKAAGQKRCNLLEFERMGYRMRVVEDQSLTGREFRLEEVSVCT